MKSYVSNLVFIHILVLLSLTSCETVERTQATNMCNQIAFQKIPIKNESYACQDYVCKNKVVKTGEVCTTECGDFIRRLDGRCTKVVTKCEDTTKVKQDCKYENKTCIRDINKTQRTNWILNCANSACLSAYGNINCTK